MHNHTVPSDHYTVLLGCIYMYMYMYMCVNMHMIKAETLEATSPESLWVLIFSGPNWGSNPDLLIGSQTLLPLSYWVSGGRGVQD